MKNLWINVVDRLEAGEELVVMKVIQHKGSTPRGSGAWMVVGNDGQSMGTVGGGKLEADVLASAADAFKKKRPSICKLDMTQSELTSTSMICGGKVEVLVDYLKMDDFQKDFYREMRQCLENREKTWLVTRLDTNGPYGLWTRHYLVKRNKNVIGDVDDPRTLGEAECELFSRIEKPSLVEIDGKQYWVEPLLTVKRLLLFGAGHVGKATAMVADLAGFETLVIDDRQAFLNREIFPETVELHWVEDFTRCLESQSIDEDSYIVIVTRGHMHDRDVLAQALKTDAAYIGMIGSRKKRDTIYKNLMESGFEESDIKRIHSPIGIDIKAETPEEIAVSIVAELIQVRAEKAET